MLATHQDPLPPLSPALARTPLPAALPALDGIDLHSLYDTVRTHGDFFDAITVGSRVLFFLTDIAGTRDRAHPIAAVTQDVFREQGLRLFEGPEINLIDQLSDLAHVLNQTILHSAHGARFAPTFIACYDLSLNLLAYLNAGGQTAIFRDSDGTRPLGNVSIPLGLFSHRTYEPAVQAFEPGAKLLLVTKGVTESRPGQHCFDETKAAAVLKDFTGTTARDLCRTTLERAQNFRHHPWYVPLHLPFLKPDPIEDLTAVALIRTA